MRKHGNRLADEKSPYLLQHSQNPVDWYPWGDEAFEKARKEDKPILLSIGYSTCHWCHVMARESFEDDKVAELLNDAFVCVKVDREERPDIDGIYMTVCQAITGGGGWPLTIVMTAEKKPFYAATYIPKQNKYGRLGLLELVPKIQELWREKRSDLERSANQIVSILANPPESERGGQLGVSSLQKTFAQLAASFDEIHGGFGRAPKFPTAHNLLFLLRYWRRSGDASCLEMVESTLRSMRMGGVYDQVGFGFHRYSTDAEWFVPHFEKMLYDQAMLSMAYVEAFQATGKEEYARTAKEIFTYVLRDMTSKKGGFLSAEDADSEGVEGRFYTWTLDEIKGVMDRDESEIVIDVFGIMKEGNYSDKEAGGRGRWNILRMLEPLADASSRLGLADQVLKVRLDRAIETLFQARSRRVRPHKDDKVLTDWNGLMIAALSKGAKALGDAAYAEAARKAADFIMDGMRTDGWRLFHRYRDGQAAIPANLDDYAFMAWGLQELYEVTLDISYLESALQLTKVILTHFWDDKAGGFFFTPDDAEPAIVRQKHPYDGAIPSGNAVALAVLLKLGRITGDADLAEKAAATIAAFAGGVSRNPLEHTHLMTAVDFALGPTKEVVITGRLGDEGTESMLREVRSKFLPDVILIFRPIEEAAPAIVGLADFTRDLKGLNGRATAYVCSDRTCNLPTNEVETLIRSLEPAKRRFVTK